MLSPTGRLSALCPKLSVCTAGYPYHAFEQAVHCCLIGAGLITGAGSLT
jgi:hypothetical protein